MTDAQDGRGGRGGPDGRYAEHGQRRERIRGCLIGGAIGDALGWPVEFQRLDPILDANDQDGVTRLHLDRQGLAEVTDDTQMTLFTAEGLLLAKGAGPAEVTASVHAAYRRWLLTQWSDGPGSGPAPSDDEGRLLREPWLWASRAPGNACISGLTEYPNPVPPVAFGQPGPVNPHSKGCGTVMRSAPFGLLGLGPEAAFRLAADCAQLTHGHPTGYLAAGAFAAVVERLVAGVPPIEAVVDTMVQLAEHPGHEETFDALSRALSLAEVDRQEGTAGFASVERVGLGWIAEECLAIAVYCLLVVAPGPGSGDGSGPGSGPEGLRRALTLSVTHSGDSDSSGAVCGNLLGAAHGLDSLPEDWAHQVEGRTTLLDFADELDARAAR